MTTLVTADNKGRIPLRAQPGRKYLVFRAGDEWHVAPYSEGVPRNRNRREWTGSKNGHDLFEAIGQMGKLGLRIERAENAKRPVPLCLF